MNTLNKTKRKAQEEIVGFILIVVIVSIILVIFLGIKLRNPEPTQRTSEVVYQFLESSMEQTTDCALSSGADFLALDAAIRACYVGNSACIGGSSTCATVEDTLGQMLNHSWAVGPQYPYKGYEVEGIYTVNSSGQQNNEEVFSVSKGNCSNSFIGNSYWIPEFPGSIIVSAKLCS